MTVHLLTWLTYLYRAAAILGTVVPATLVLLACASPEEVSATITRVRVTETSRFGGREYSYGTHRLTETNVDGALIHIHLAHVKGDWLWDNGIRYENINLGDVPVGLQIKPVVASTTLDGVDGSCTDPDERWLQGSGVCYNPFATFNSRIAILALETTPDFNPEEDFTINITIEVPLGQDPNGGYTRDIVLPVTPSITVVAESASLWPPVIVGPMFHEEDDHRAEIRLKGGLRFMLGTEARAFEFDAPPGITITDHRDSGQDPVDQHLLTVVGGPVSRAERVTITIPKNLHSGINDITAFFWLLPRATDNGRPIKDITVPRNGIFTPIVFFADMVSGYPDWLWDYSFYTLVSGIVRGPIHVLVPVKGKNAPLISSDFPITVTPIYAESETIRFTIRVAGEISVEPGTWRSVFSAAGLPADIADGDTIHVSAGEYKNVGVICIDKRVILTGEVANNSGTHEEYGVEGTAWRDGNEFPIFTGKIQIRLVSDGVEVRGLVLNNIASEVPDNPAIVDDTTAGKCDG